MGKSGKRGREEAETYDSDGGFVSNDEGTAPKKKSKVTTNSKGNEESTFWEVCYQYLAHFNR